MLHTYRNTSIIGACAILSGLTGCSSDDATTPTSTAELAVPSDHPLVIVTERDGPEGALHYLHVVANWPESGELSYEDAIELGTPGVTRVEYGALYFYQAEEGSIEKFSIADGKLERGEVISFSQYDIKGYDPEPIWASEDASFLLDEKSGQIARWNPSTMEIDEVFKLDPDVLKRDDLNVQFQLGTAAEGRLFTAASWRNWDTNRVYPGIALAVFDEDAPAGGPQQVIRDERCAPSVAVSPFLDEEGNIYAVGDGATGYDLAANPNKSKVPQCVVRMRPDANEFDSDFFLDLQEVTGSPVIFMVFPMGDHKLLANMWDPEVDIAEHADPDMPGWYWEFPPYFQYAIIDMDDRSVSKVDELPSSAVQSQKSLRVDGEVYVQQFREDRGSSLHRVDPDGKVTEVLTNPAAASIQFIGRL